MYAEAELVLCVGSFDADFDDGRRWHDRHSNGGQITDRLDLRLARRQLESDERDAVYGDDLQRSMPVGFLYSANPGSEERA